MELHEISSPPRPLQAVERISPNAEDANPVAGRGFSLNVTFRLWPFVLAVEVTRLSQTEESSGLML